MKISRVCFSMCVLLITVMLSWRAEAQWPGEICLPELRSLEREVAKHDSQKVELSASAIPDSLTERELNNLIAFTRLTGYVRYFHPSDEVAITNWDEFCIQAIPIIRGASNPTDLAQTLQDYFAPIAPSVRVYPTGTGPSDIPGMIPPQPADSLYITQWYHKGVGFDYAHSFLLQQGVSIDKTYFSRRLTEFLPYTAVPAGFHDPETPFVRDLAGSVTCMVPLALFGTRDGTFPPSPVSNPWAEPTDPFDYSGNDQGTRLAGVTIAWNIFQHFFPYFDVIETDWPSMLRRTLAAAAVDANGRVFLNTLRLLVAALNDGHGLVGHWNYDQDFMVPRLVVRWIEDRLVVTYVDSIVVPRIQRGDVVVAIDGVPAEQALEEEEKFISGSPQWKRHNATQDVIAGTYGKAITLDIQSVTGDCYAIRLERTAYKTHLFMLAESRPDKIDVVGDNFYYVDISRIKEMNEFEDALPQLQNANGLIFDLRGYPGGPFIIDYLIDEPAMWTQCYIPLATFPDREHVSFFCTTTDLFLTPKYTLSKIKKVFLTDERAISYGETYMDIVASNRIADVVGKPTAGTNGAVNPFYLPGGYAIMWTGMKVLKAEGSQLYGIGVTPTHPVSRTVEGVAQGRDEVLEYAMDLLGVYAVDAEPNTGHAPLTVQLTFNPSHLIMPVSMLAWDFDNNGLIDSHEQYTEWTYEQPGDYTICLGIEGSDRFDTLTYKDFIRVFDGESALLFDGEQSIVSCPAAPCLNVTDALTIEAWIRPQGWGKFENIGFGRIIDKEQFALYLVGTESAMNRYSLACQLSHADGGMSLSCTPENSIALDQWQHVAATYDAGLSRVSIYINGIEQTLTQSPAPSGPIEDNANGDLVIGDALNGTFTFDGYIDEVRLWACVRTEEEIRVNLNSCLEGNESGLVGYWSMNEGNGETVFDQSENRNNCHITDVLWREGVPFDMPLFDADVDGIMDWDDNCPCVSNPDQEDGDGNGMGDACESFRGDADGNCVIDILDVLKVVNIVLGQHSPTAYEHGSGDCDRNGLINILDVLGIVNVVLGIGVCPPVACKPIVNDEVIGLLESLKKYLSPEGYERLMDLMKQVQIPHEYHLSQNYPNPFNPRTDIRYQIPDGRYPVHTILKVFNVLGQEVRTLVDEVQEAGYYAVAWDGMDEQGRAVSSGIYFYRMITGNYHQTKKMILLR